MNLTFGSKMDNITIGRLGEDIATAFLESKGYEILERNWRWLRIEVDIIVMKDNTLTVVEVKTRTSNQYGDPDYFDDDRKLAILLDAAAHYAEKISHTWSIGIDIVGILLHKDGSHSLKHIEDVYFPTF